MWLSFTRTRTSSWSTSLRGSSCIPGAGNRTGTLVQGLLARYPEIASIGDPARPGIVHRIDKDTSGLLAVARSELGLRTAVRTDRGARGDASLPGVGVGSPGFAARNDRRADRSIGAHADAHGRVGSGSRGEDDVRSRGDVRRSRGGVAPRVHAGHRPHPPDPRASPDDRSSGGGRPPVRRSSRAVHRPPPVLPPRRASRARPSGDGRARRVRLAARSGARSSDQSAAGHGFSPRAIAATSARVSPSSRRRISSPTPAHTASNTHCPS